MTAALLFGLIAHGSGQKATMHDELLQKLVGNWHITRQFSNRKAENTAKVEWVLDGHWLKIQMKDVAKPSKYEAQVFITRMESDKSFSIHWLDTFGGTLPESLGTGHRKGESIEFVWKDSDGELKNTFTWHENEKTWSSKIEQTDKDGKWNGFCTDTYIRAH